MTFKLPELPYAYDALHALHVGRDAAVPPRQASSGLRRQRQQAASPARSTRASRSRRSARTAFADKNAGLVNNVGQHYNHIHFWQWMKKGGGGKKLPGKLEKLVDGLRRLRQGARRLHQGRRDAVRLGLGVARDQGRQARSRQDAERREPADARRRSRSSAATCGSTATTSTTATRARSTSRPGSTTW